jgi:ATP-dependent Clp protease ATP-binding subunit ClpC
MVDDLTRFTERARKVLELSLREALSLGHNYVGTEHILLALVRQNDGIGTSALLALGCDAKRVRQEVIRQLSAASDDDRIRRIVREELAARG